MSLQLQYGKEIYIYKYGQIAAVKTNNFLWPFCIVYKIINKGRYKADFTNNSIKNLKFLKLK